MYMFMLFVYASVKRYECCDRNGKKVTRKCGRRAATIMEAKCEWEVKCIKYTCVYHML